jgi:type IV pilus assembly protein PilO
MEQLELLVQPSDLELIAVEDPADAEDPSVKVVPTRTRLKLRLTFFDQAAETGNGSGPDSDNKGAPSPS